MCAFCTAEAIDFSLQRPRCWDLSEFCKLLQGVRFSSSPNGTALLEFVKLCAEPPDTLLPPPFCKKRGLGCFGKLLSLVSHLDPLYAPVHPWALGARRPWPCPGDTSCAGHRLPARSLDLAHAVSRRQYNINQGIDECCSGRLTLRSHQLLLPWL